MQVLRLALVVVISVLAPACNGKSNPAAPAAPAAPTATTLVISGVDAVRTDLVTNYTATVTLSDGTTRAVTPTWTSSNTGVASVDSAGRLVGLAHGSTSLTASHEGRSASKTVQVVNNYEGSWAGRYVIRACQDSGIYEDGVFGGNYEDVPWCQAFDRVGSVHPITLALSQTGSNQSEISGTLNGTVGTVVITGVVTGDGRLNLGGTSGIPDFEGEICCTLHVAGWDTNLSGPGVMVGRWTQSLVGSYGRDGTVYQENELVTMTRTSTGVPPASATQAVFDPPGITGNAGRPAIDDARSASSESRRRQRLLNQTTLTWGDNSRAPGRDRKKGIHAHDERRCSMRSTRGSPGIFHGMLRRESTYCAEFEG